MSKCEVRRDQLFRHDRRSGGLVLGPLAVSVRTSEKDA
jgi:hypothetical protein